jgi:molybdenum cofactor biosynthesis enzyme MoaA/ribosomal protein S18 acetylase RimI-like enzyme
MTWLVEPAQDLPAVFDLYRQVFDENLTPDDFQRFTSGYDTYVFSVCPEGQAPAGFAILRGRGESVELWQMGVLQEKRMQGAGAHLLAHCEKKMAEKGYARLTVNSYNRWHVMLSILTRRGYRIVGTTYSDRRDDLKIKLYRVLRPRKELRYALTEICNFKCLFCHNEGLGRDVRQQLPKASVLHALQEAVRLGYTDITFTGGEPLLKKKRLAFLIDELGKMPVPPEVTVVTNASLLDSGFIDTLAAYPGGKKIHLSMHANDEPTFKKITRKGRNGLLDRVKDNIRMATAAGLCVKVNHVVLRDLNHDKVLDTVEMIRGLGASTVKFIELLVLPENPQDYRMYYDVTALHGQIGQIANGPYRKSPRQQVYRHKDDSRFEIELQRCTCALGCGHCCEIRDRTFSSDLFYHPCFVRSGRRFKIDRPEKIKDVFLNGDRIIDGFASRYRDSSPTLIQKESYVTGRCEFFYQVDSVAAFSDYLRRKGFKLFATHGFHEEYYRPKDCGAAWKNFERVLKIGWEHHNRSRVDLVYTDHRYTPHADLGLESVTRFLQSTGPMTFDSAEIARHFLDRLDFDSYMQLEWEIETWQGKDLEINLSTGDWISTVRVLGSTAARQFMEIMQDYDGDIRPVHVPLAQFMLAAEDQGP